MTHVMAQVFAAESTPPLGLCLHPLWDHLVQSYRQETRLIGSSSTLTVWVEHHCRGTAVARPVAEILLLLLHWLLLVMTPA